MTLTEFIAARLGDLQAGAWAIHDVSKCDALLYEDLPASAPLPDGMDCECGYPARVLRHVAAMRAILARYEDCLARMEDPDYPAAVARDQAREYEDFVLPNLATAWADHPDYDEEEWAP